MNEFDSTVQQSLISRRDELDRAHALAAPAAGAAVFHRARRRTLVGASRAGALALAVVAGVIAFEAPSSTGRDPRPEVRGPVYAAGSQQEAQEGLGLWPAVEADDALPYCEDLLSGSVGVASQFANALLTWNNVAIKDDQRDGDARVITIGNLPSTYTGGPLPAHAEVAVTIERLGSGDCWWVTGAETLGGGSVEVAAEGDDLRATVAFPEGARRAEVISVDSTDEPRGYAVGDRGQTEFRIVDFDGPGYVLVLWKADDGTVVGGTGVTIPARG